MIKKIILLCFLMFSPSKSHEIENHDFYGKHYMLNYLHCDTQILYNRVGIFMALYAACVESGAHVLSWCGYKFDNGGLTLCLCLSESHATIHTYPELGHCFIDFFACGKECNMNVFNAFMKNYLAPAKYECLLVERGPYFYMLEEVKV